ncbi:MAG: NADH-quinone oxidoreductase subunit L [Pseudomonadota bacterium]
MLDAIYTQISLQTLIWLVVAFPLVGAAINGALAIGTARAEGAKFLHFTSFIGCAAPLLSLAAAGILFFTLTGFEQTTPAAITGPLFRWAVLPDLVVDVGLRVDELSLLMMLTVSGVGALIHIYSVGYMWGDDGFVRYFAELNLFMFFMLLLVMADNLVLMFIGWEGVALCSYLLISFWFEGLGSARAGTKAFIVNTVGDAGFLLGMFLIFGVMSAAHAAPESGFFNFETMERYGAYFVPVATAASLLLFTGAVAKSAQIPLYVWLPDAMVGPTPVSALIHAATMVAAGVYMVVRLNYIFALSPIALEIVAVVGASTALVAAMMGLAATDLKKILAYSTISQLGYMFLAVGVGAFSAAIFHLMTHAFFKALLFVAAGSAIKALGGEYDIRKMGGLKKRMPITTWAFVIGAAALAGIAPASGFFSKDAILWQTFERGHGLLWTCGFIGVGLTAFYIFRAAGSVFFGEPKVSLEKFKKITEPCMSMLVPIMILISLAAFAGFVGVSPCLGGEDHIGFWLGGLIPFEMSRAPTEASCGTQVVLVVLTLLWSLHFSVLGWLIYAQKRDWPERVAKKLRPLSTLVSHRFYIDEIYDLIVVRPLMWVSKHIVWKGFDSTVVDGIAVEGTSRTIGLMSALVSSAQTGILQHYLLYFLIGAVLIIGLVAL